MHRPVLNRYEGAAYYLHYSRPSTAIQRMITLISLIYYYRNDPVVCC